jgi:hypothetical protein
MGYPVVGMMGNPITSGRSRFLDHIRMAAWMRITSSSIMNGLDSRETLGKASRRPRTV